MSRGNRLLKLTSAVRDSRLSAQLGPNWGTPQTPNRHCAVMVPGISVGVSNCLNGRRQPLGQHMRRCFPVWPRNNRPTCLNYIERLSNSEDVCSLLHKIGTYSGIVKLSRFQDFFFLRIFFFKCPNKKIGKLLDFFLFEFLLKLIQKKFGLFLVNDMQTLPPPLSSLKSDHIGFLVPRDAQCSETYANAVVWFIFIFFV